jgi:predicted GNAT superfamily acetyltransferase
LTVIRDAQDTDFANVLALNAESERFLSPMDASRLARLHAQAACHRVLEIDSTVIAFLLAFRSHADYDSPNYRWFAARYSSFLYIDRVVVSAPHRGHRYGAALYEDAFRFARQHGIATITCEFDVVPPNETSRRFHSRFGFREVGTQWYGKKRVSMQCLD